MTEQQLTRAILERIPTYQDRMEECIVKGAIQFFQKKKTGIPQSNVLYDLKQSQQEAYALGAGKDLCYDRFTTGVLYSLFYQGRRIHTSLEYVARFVAAIILRKRPARLLDLGAGTGAVHISLGVCFYAAAELGYAAPSIQMINIDSSPVMLDYARSYLLPAFYEAFPGGFRSVIPAYEAVSWTNIDQVKRRDTYLVASYLFDQSENREAVADTFEQLILTHRPEKIALLTSWRKQHLVQTFAQRDIVQDKYRMEKLSRPHLLRGGMTKVQNLRQRINAKYGSVLSRHHNLVTWYEKSFYAELYAIREGAFLSEGMFADEPNSDSEQINLFLPPIRIRTEIRLSPEQLAASELNDRPTIIVGPAGSGKSVVLTERIKNRVEVEQYRPDLRILLTTFNKGLTAYLKEWLISLLNSDRLKDNRAPNGIWFNGSNQPNIQILNFDKLPTHFAGMRGKLIYDHEIKKRMQTVLDELLSSRSEQDRKRFERFLDPFFFYQEYVRVVYGSMLFTREEYLNGTRIGRPFIFKYGSEERSFIYDVIRTFLDRLDKERIGAQRVDTIHSRRLRLFRQLEAGEINRFDYVFVDEFQDCTPADYQMFYGLLNDVNRLVVSGDYAQAVHLGTSVQSPRADRRFTDEEYQKVRKIHRLEGSYRLPFRIAEAVRPLSENIKAGHGDLNVDIITPYRGAPPGARPILVYASDSQSMATKLAYLHWHYQIYGFEPIKDTPRKRLAILEKDWKLTELLNKRSPGIAETNTILRLKGLEKDCVVWTTRIPIVTPGDEDYFVYTILTRTRSILIIALFDNSIKRYLELIAKLDPDRLMLWDEETERFYEEKIHQHTVEALVM